MNRSSEAESHENWGEILTVAEVAARLRISRDLVRDMLLRGELAAAKVGTHRGRRGGRWLIPAVAVDEWLEHNVGRS